MKKIFGAMFALALGVTGVSGFANASPIGLSGPWASSVTPADPANFNVVHIGATVLGLSLGLSENVDYIGRLSSDDVVFNPLKPGLAGASLSGTGLGGKTGSWTFVSGADLYEIVAVEIDAGNLLGAGLGKIYLTDPVANAGFWDTSDFTVGIGPFSFTPNLNYLDFYGVKVGAADVPEPMTLLLVGGGLAMVIRRKKRA
ncbi:MAG TPA: PEP-CTERM sorting domain-containing protein [Rhizomicrobium sp.]|nr:PEP-CTERM sorting domain-containing protein [Rhizomicrobium sp.]